MQSTTRQIENELHLLMGEIIKAQERLAIPDENMPILISVIHHQVQHALERPQKPHLTLVANSPK